MGTKSRWFSSVALVLLIIMIAAAWPLSTDRRVKLNPKDFIATKVAAGLPGPDQGRLDAQLATLRAQGYKVSEPQVFHITKKASWWQRLWTLHADIYYNDNGYTSLTPIDTGNPTTGAMWVYATSGTAAVWGGIGWDNNGNAYTWGEGMVAEVPKSRLDQWAARLCPTLYAIYACDGGWVTSRNILLDSFSTASAVMGGAYFSGCATYYCLEASFLVGFNFAIYSNVRDLWSTCWY